MSQEQTRIIEQSELDRIVAVSLTMFSALNSARDCLAAYAVSSEKAKAALAEVTNAIALIEGSEAKGGAK